MQYRHCAITCLSVRSGTEDLSPYLNSISVPHDTPHHTLRKTQDQKASAQRKLLRSSHSISSFLKLVHEWEIRPSKLTGHVQRLVIQVS